jgi:hypothetical protein
LDEMFLSLRVMLDRVHKIRLPQIVSSIKCVDVHTLDTDFVCGSQSGSHKQCDGCVLKRPVRWVAGIMGFTNCCFVTERWRSSISSSVCVNLMDVREA